LKTTSGINLEITNKDLHCINLLVVSILKLLVNLGSQKLLLVSILKLTVYLGTVKKYYS
jgi:hypothetical protein